MSKLETASFKRDIIDLVDSFSEGIDEEKHRLWNRLEDKDKLINHIEALCQDSKAVVASKITSLIEDFNRI